MQDCPETGESRTRLVRVLGAGAGLSVSGSDEERVAAIAAVQRGRVSREQLLAAGISYKVIARLVRRNMLFPLPGGVFAAGSLAPVELGDETAALLAAGPGAALSHSSAASLWEMRPPGAAVEVVVPHNRGVRLARVHVHRSRLLAAKDIRFHKGLPVTSPARTLLDLTAILTPRQLELAFDRALVKRIMRLGDVEDVLARMPGRTGTPVLRAVLADHRGPTLTRSQAEELFLALVRRAQLPQPRVNARTAGYEVDFLWPAERVVVEIDGFRYHSTRRAFDHDHRKDQVLFSAGLIVLRFTYEQLKREPLNVIAQVAGALGARKR